MTEDISIEYDLNDEIVKRWRREFEAKNKRLFKEEGIIYSRARN